MTQQVTCAHCRDGVGHAWHWYDGCTCAAGGVGEDHSPHCDLYGYLFVRDDTLLNSQPEDQP